MHARWAFAAGVAVLLAGCAGPATDEPDLRVSARWYAWQDDPRPHLFITLSNMGAGEVRVGPGGEELVVTGPQGLVPVEWGGTAFARSIAPGQSVVVGFHPRASEDGLGRPAATGPSMMLSIDHATGVGLAPPPGHYQVCVGHSCADARLA